jgi:hypothetical protein
LKKIIQIKSSGKYHRSDEVASKEVGGEIVIVPAHRGLAAEEDVLFTLTGTGMLIWNLLDGTHSVQQMIDHILQHYDVSAEQAKRDVFLFLEELVARRMIVS